MKLILLTSLAMLAFAANSVIGRIALTENASGSAFIDPGNYTLIRIVSGATILCALTGLKHGLSKQALNGSHPISALFLLGYAAAFSYSYVSIDTGMGALILFACVQLSMFAWAIFKQEKPHYWEYSGSIIALLALSWLVSPGLTAPPLIPAMLMVISGIAWAGYTIRGQKSPDPLSTSAGNFLIASPIALLFLNPTNITHYGILLAVLSGALTSGLGYALWYSVLPNLSTTRAAISQLSVPILAGIGGSFILAEEWSARFSISSLFILGGIGLAIFGKQARN
ncbi:DMT family transporter [Hirschia maritima]|uniref:DMT family transporter n=1 Tax=Hirschia maritima TaxID=1121961 RepID=UPI0004759115|nr:DMT family transporter [Hirschia maritima]